jgi:hypothetical protein
LLLGGEPVEAANLGEERLGAWRDRPRVAWPGQARLKIRSVSTSKGSVTSCSIGAKSGWATEPMNPAPPVTSTRSARLALVSAPPIAASHVVA